MKHHVLVLGAGMIGTCTALQLALRGHTVSLVDRRAPGCETSYGNAGLIQREAVEPYAFPRDLGTLLRVGLKRGADVNYHLRALPGLAAPLARYWANSAPTSHARIAQAHTRLIERCTTEHQALITLAGAADLVRREGYRAVYRDPASLEQAIAHAQALAHSHGLRHAVLGPDALAQAEPALRRRLEGAIHWLDTWAVSAPGELVACYAALLQRQGGTIVEGDAATLSATRTGWRVQTAQGQVEAEHAVIALGPWSDRLLRTLGYRYPLFVKRGYHRHFRGGVPPQLTMFDVDRGVVIAPMQRGVRITTGAEFARQDAAPTPVQLERATALAAELIDLPQAVEPEPWMGSRPCTPDMLPVMGAAPHHRGLWFNFGHAHQGFTLGPVSGVLLADLIESGTPVVKPQPYSPLRFE